MWFDILWSCGLVLFTGTVALGIVRAVNHEHLWHSKKFFLTTHLFLLVVFHTALQDTGIKERWTPKGNRARRVIAEHFELVKNHPRMIGFLNQTQNEEEARALQLVIAIKGTARLEPGQLVERARMMASLLAGAEDSVCADLFKGSMTPSTLEKQLVRMSDAELNSWAKLQAESVRAFLDNRPVRTLGRDEIGITVRKLAEINSQEDLRRLMKGLLNRSETDPSEVCWVARKLHQNILRLPEPYNKALAILSNS